MCVCGDEKIYLHTSSSCTQDRILKRQFLFFVNERERERERRKVKEVGKKGETACKVKESAFGAWSPFFASGSWGRVQSSLQNYFVKNLKR